MERSGTATQTRPQAHGQRSPGASIAPRRSAPRRSAPEAGREPKRRVLRAPLIAMLAVATVAAVGYAIAPRHHHAPNPAAGLPTPGAVPTAFHITYRVTTDQVVTTEDLWVRRPFEAEDDTYAGPGIAGQPASSVVTRLGRQQLSAGGTTAAVFETGPAAAPFDVRLDALDLPHTQTRAITIVGTGTVAGRSCHLLRTAQPLTSSTFGAVPTTADHTDTCVDGGGLVLSERRVKDGRLVQSREAVTVDTGPAAAGHTVATTGMHIALKDGGGRVLTVDPASRPPGLDFWELAAPPAGFRHLGRFAVVPPHQTQSTGASLVAVVDDVYLRGPDVIVVEQGGTLGAGGLQAPGGGERVSAGALGVGQLSIAPGSSTVTALLARNRTFVRVSGTVPPAQLLGVARALRAQPAGTLVTIPDLTSDVPA